MVRVQGSYFYVIMHKTTDQNMKTQCAIIIIRVLIANKRLDYFNFSLYSFGYLFYGMLLFTKSSSLG